MLLCFQSTGRTLLDLDVELKSLFRVRHNQWQLRILWRIVSSIARPSNRYRWTSLGHSLYYQLRLRFNRSPPHLQCPHLPHLTSTVCETITVRFGCGKHFRNVTFPKSVSSFFENLLRPYVRFIKWVKTITQPAKCHTNHRLLSHHHRKPWIM